jgi:hypothetical protein
VYENYITQLLGYSRLEGIVDGVKLSVFVLTYPQNNIITANRPEYKEMIRFLQTFSTISPEIKYSVSAMVL